MDKIDLQAFSDENFDAINWINSAFASSNANDNQETFASNLVFKLQLFVQEINSSLEETAQQMLHNLPKVMRETETLHGEACLLRQDMRSVKEKLNKLEHETSDSMQSLVSIDAIKTRMQDTRKALQEADNWTTLSGDVEDVFINGDIHAIASKLISMQNSLDILVDVIDYDERVKHLETLKDRFEAMLETGIISAFTAQTDGVQMYVKLFKDLKRVSHLKRYYHGCLKNQLLSEWKRIISMDPEENVLDWTNSMNDYLLSTWHSQMNFCNQVMFNHDFSSVLETLCDLYVDVLSNLEPTISSCITGMLNKQANKRECVIFLIEMKQITDRFAKSIEMSLVNTSSGGNQFLDKPHVALLAQVLYSPYRELIETYANIECQALLDELEKVKSISQPSESLSKAFSHAKEAEKRCYQLTQSCAIAFLLDVFSTYFNNYLKHFNSLIDDLRNKSSMIEIKSSIPDWSLFQLSLFTLQASGELVIQLELMQQQLYTSSLDVSKKIASTLTTSPFQRYHELMLDSNAKTELINLINSITQKASHSHILSHIFDDCQQICSRSANVVLDISLNYIEKHLEEVNNLVTLVQESAIEEEEMHAFSLSPQEYMTQIGQYLMTIPQHIEPFILQENNAFKVALAFCGIKEVNKDLIISENIAAQYLLDCITQKTIDAYISKITKMKSINVMTKQQLITDIGYLRDVLDDLGLSSDHPEDQLTQVHALLKATPQEFQQVASKSDAVIVRAIETLLMKT